MFTIAKHKGYNIWRKNFFLSKYITHTYTGFNSWPHPQTLTHGKWDILGPKTTGMLRKFKTNDIYF